MKTIKNKAKDRREVRIGKKLEKKSQVKIQAPENKIFILRFSKKSQVKIQASKNQRFSGLYLDKKGQVKIQEMAFMLVALLFFFIIVGIFGFGFLVNELRANAVDVAEQRTFSALVSLSDTAEFSCSVARPNCIDADKLIVMTNRTVYSRFYPFASLKVIRFQAFNKDPEDMVQCTMANYPDCDIFVVYENENENVITTATYASLCMKDYENGANYYKCEVARILGGTRQ